MLFAILLIITLACIFPKLTLVGFIVFCILTLHDPTKMIKTFNDLKIVMFVTSLSILVYASLINLSILLVLAFITLLCCIITEKVVK